MSFCPQKNKWYIYLFIYLFGANQKEHSVSDDMKEKQDCCKCEWKWYIFNAKFKFFEVFVFIKIIKSGCVAKSVFLSRADLQQMKINPFLQISTFGRNKTGL